MPAPRKAMRKIKDVLRLKYEAGLTHDRIARACGVAKGTVAKYVERAQAAGLSWPLPADLDDAALEARLFPRAPGLVAAHAPPDCGYLHQEMKRPGVTLMLLWEEYAHAHPGQAYGYSQFCLLYKTFRQSLQRSMRQIYPAGEKIFIDYSGDKVTIIDRATGAMRFAEIFVAVLGASAYAYAEATWTQQLPDWIAAHVRLFAHLMSVPALLIPDNLKSGIQHPCRYDPEANSTYADMARHYGTAILPARPAAPRDKAHVEAGVLLVQRWILARLRNQPFFSLEELNRAIRALLADLNNRPFKKLPGSRRSAFETIDRPAMIPLPATPYEFATWKVATVSIDYHVEVDGHYYSVPHPLVRQKIEARLTASTVEFFFKSKRVAVHARALARGKFTTLAEHMPEAHRRHREWTPGRLLRWAHSIGPKTQAIVQWQFDHRPHPEQGYRACLGLLNLGKRYGNVRLEAACQRALAIGSPVLKSVKSILEARLDQQPPPGTTPEGASAIPPVHHDNVRGAAYFQSTTQTSTRTEGESEPC